MNATVTRRPGLVDRKKPLSLRGEVVVELPVPLELQLGEHREASHEKAMRRRKLEVNDELVGLHGVLLHLVAHDVLNNSVTEGRVRETVERAEEVVQKFFWMDLYISQAKLTS